MNRSVAFKRLNSSMFIPAWCLLFSLSLVFFGRSGYAQEMYELTDDGQWDKTEVLDPATPEGKLQLARRHLAEGEAGRARKLLKQWIDQYPNHPQMVEAWLLHGDAKVAGRDYYNSLYDYETVIREYPSSPLFHTALEREYEIAQMFAKGMKRSFVGMRVLPAYGEAEEIFIRIQERAPGSEIGEMASMALADFYFDHGDMGSASEAYDLFMINYPRSVDCEKAMLRLIQANLSRYQGPMYDPTGLIEAKERLRVYQEQYPAAAADIDAESLRDRINDSLAETDLTSAKWYDRRNVRVSAIYLYRRVVEDYPHSPSASEAIDRLEALGEAVVSPEEVGG